MSNIHVSVIIPVYNVEQYVEECITSVLAQSLENIEIIIVDDCSTDGSLKICRKFAEQNRNTIKLYCHDQNLGHSSARNTGMKHATGEYIGFIDSDDYIGVDRFKTLYEKAKESDADVVLCGPLPNCEIDIIKEGLYTDPLYTEKILGNFLVYLKPDGRFHNYSVHVWRRLYKRSFLENNGIVFLNKLESGEDRFFSYEVHFFAQRMYYLNTNEKEGYFYRQRPASITHTYQSNSWLTRRIILCNLLDFLHSHSDMTNRRIVYESRLPLLVFMFSILCFKNEYSRKNERKERIKKIESIMQDPICYDFITKLDVTSLCNEYKKYYHYIIQKNARRIDHYMVSKQRIGRIVQRIRNLLLS